MTPCASFAGVFSVSFRTPLVQMLQNGHSMELF